MNSSEAPDDTEKLQPDEEKNLGGEVWLFPDGKWMATEKKVYDLVHVELLPGLCENMALPGSIGFACAHRKPTVVSGIPWSRLTQSNVANYSQPYTFA